MAEDNSLSTNGNGERRASFLLTSGQNNRINDAIAETLDDTSNQEDLRLIQSELVDENSQLRQSILHDLVVSKINPTDVAVKYNRWKEKDLKVSFQFLEVVKAMAKAVPSRQEVWDKIVQDGHHNMASQYFDMDAVAREFKTGLAEWSRPPSQEAVSLESKGTTYTAISGASGSGKSCTLIWMGNKWIESLMRNETILRIYLSCTPDKEEKPAEYAGSQIKKIIDGNGRGYDVENLKSECKGTVLSLMMDEVPRRWEHEDYLEIARTIRSSLSFKQVFVMVAGTALSFDVTSQPTAAKQVFNMRLLPLGVKKMKQALQYHLEKDTLKNKENREKNDLDIPTLATTLLSQMPLLQDLLTNQRCARLTGETLLQLLDKMEEIPPGWCRGHAAVLLSMVSSNYRGLNGLKDMRPATIRKLMLQSLALTTLQKRYDCDNEGVEKNPEYLSATKEVVEAGLVERTIIPDDDVPNKDGQFKVDEGYEWSMSPAVTLMCVSTLVPWISGVHDAADHFELLVATTMAAIRFGQTGIEFPVIQLEKAVPYSKNEDHHYFYPERTEDVCLVNGPQAPYSDLMIAKAANQKEPADNTTIYLRTLASSVTKECILVQCKATDSDYPSLNEHDEYNKMGFVWEGQIRKSPDVADVAGSALDKKKYRSGRWLTKKSFGGDSACVMFATNKMFNKIEIEVVRADCEAIIEGGDKSTGGGRGNDYAWQCLYPFNQLVRTPGAFSPIHMKRLKEEIETEPGLQIKKESERGTKRKTDLTP